MRVFHELVLDKYIEGATGFGGVINKLYWDAVIGAVDTARLMVIADHVSGSAVVLNVAVAEEPELTATETANFDFVTTVLSNAPLSVGQTNIFNLTLTDPNVPMSYGSFLYVSLNGTTPKARVRIWVTGRGRA